MRVFQTLFGIEASQVKNTCILMPIMRKEILAELGIRRFSRGRLYDSGNSKLFTAIRTGVGPALSGDAVLYLSETKCRNIILFGSCGSTDGRHLKIGDLAAPFECRSMESFSRMLSGDKGECKIFNPDKGLLEGFLKSSKGHNIQNVSCASLGSLKLEQGYLGIFKEKDIRVVDMECSALFSASAHIKKRSMAFFYVTDVVNERPFYGNLTAGERLLLSSSIRSAARTLCRFIKDRLSA